MNDSKTPKPTLRLFCRAPEAAAEQRELFSSLQTFETSLLALAFRRYPHALVLVISAIESLLRNAFKVSEQENASLLGTLLPAASRKPVLADMRNRLNVDNAVLARHAFIHHGHSPRDDRDAIELFIGSALPYYVVCWREFYKFDLKDSMYESFACHLRAATNAFHLAGKKRIENSNFAISALTSHLRWIEMENAAPEGALNSLTGCSDEGFDRMNPEVVRLERIMNNPWKIACPVCSAPLAFIVELDGEELDKSNLKVTRAACANCEYVIPEPWGFLADLLCENDLQAEKEEIMQTTV